MHSIATTPPMQTTEEIAFRFKASKLAVIFKVASLSANDSFATPPSRAIRVELKSDPSQGSCCVRHVSHDTPLGGHIDFDNGFRSSRFDRRNDKPAFAGFAKRSVLEG
jgi:hypothetical protein